MLRTSRLALPSFLGLFVALAACSSSGTSGTTGAGGASASTSSGSSSGSSSSGSSSSGSSSSGGGGGGSSTTTSSSSTSGGGGAGGMTGSGGAGGTGGATGAGGAGGAGGVGGGTGGAGGAPVCKANDTQPCYDGPGGTQGIGICKAGTQTCLPDGSGFGACTGEVVPMAQEACDTPVDDNCDGVVNEPSAGCVCTPGSSASCYDGPPGTQNVGLCVGGTKTCAADGKGYGACTGQILPVAETCNTPGDDDCNGMANEGGAGCSCTPNAVVDCYSGPPQTKDVGPCKAGKQTCNAQGTGFGACTGEVVPAAETCATPIDDNCNGAVNEGGAGCVCTPNAMTPCYDGPVGTQNVGVCAGGLAQCDSQGTSLGACVGQVLPGVETCSTPVDDDCNGMTNEGGAGCVCTPNAAVACYDGPAGTKGIGACTGGTATCNGQGTALGACVGEVLPKAETCNTPVDDNCNGVTNESGAGCVCTPNAPSACYNGPAGTQGVGLCKAGTQTCNGQGTAFAACSGQVLPAANEDCNTPGDDNCNGQANEGCSAVVSYATSVEPILNTHCGSCHGGSGNFFVTSYASVMMSAGACAGKTKGECALIRIQNGSMPQGAGCTGVPANDVNNASCLTAAEQQTIQAWIGGGEKP